MFKIHFLLTVRNFRKQLFSSIINLVGLLIAMTSFIFIILFVFDELKYDSYHEHKDQTYRLLTHIKQTGERNAIFPAILYPQLISSIPEIEKSFRLYGNQKQLIKHGEDQFIDDIYFADENILNILTLPIIKGDRNNALADPFSVVITEEVAYKIFGNENPIGKELKIENNYSLNITAIIKNIPEHSHISPNILASISTLNTIEPYAMEAKENSSCNFYFLLNKNANNHLVQEKLLRSCEDFLGKQIGEMAEMVLEPLDEIYLYSTDTKWDIAKHGDIRIVVGLVSVAILIMLMAIFNFINLLSVQVKFREKEMMVRKLLGAGRRNIVKQYLFESIFYIVVALTAALVLAEIFMASFNTLTGKELTLQSIFDWQILVIILVQLTIICLFSVLYPTYIAIRENSLSRLAGNTAGNKISFFDTKFGFKQIVTVLQFVITIGLIFGSIVIYKQMQFISNSKLGFNKEHLLRIENPYGRPMYERYKTFKNLILKYPEVESVSASKNVPGENINNHSSGIRVSGRAEHEPFHCAEIAIDYGLFDTWQAKLASGRDFSENFTSDVDKAVIINEAAVKLFELETPLGEKLDGLNNSSNGQVIIGVVENIHFKSFKEKVLPIVFNLRQWSSANIVVRLKGNNIISTIQNLEKEWNELVPDRPFIYSFVDEEFGKLYNSEKRLSKLVLIFCGLAITISFIGLISLVSLIAQMRTKEIGIRKVLGASSISIYQMMIREYLNIIIVANIIALPIAYYFINKWLQQFVYRTGIGAESFILAIASAFIIGLVAISYRIIKAAMLNPVESLRSE